MKKIVFSVICIFMAVTLIAQEKYPIPVRTADQKHGRTISQFYWVDAAGIAFAKSKGVTPYEYGIYVGNLAAPTWGPGNDFEGFVKGIIYNLENFRHISDAPLVVKENEDGSVCIIANDKMIHKYFPDEKSIISYEEVKESMTGGFEPIATHMGAIITMETKDTLLVLTLKKK
jgi:hypothetical protein